jgi:hypothetical protein
MNQYPIARQPHLLTLRLESIFIQSVVDRWSLPWWAGVFAAFRLCVTSTPFGCIQETGRFARGAELAAMGVVIPAARIAVRVSPRPRTVDYNDYCNRLAMCKSAQISPYG